MPTPDSRSQSDIQTPIEPDFDPQAELQRAAAQRAAAAAADVSLSSKETPIDGVSGESNSTADLKAAADHLDEAWFESVDLAQLYEIGDPLGQGGMGIVYRAIEKQSRHPLAIKRLLPGLVANRRSLMRFQSEGNAMLKLNHENIVRFFRMGRDSISPFYIMELVEGGSLKDRLKQGKLELDEAIRMFAALAGGLSHSHKFGIIHRDIKPGNILLTLDEKPTPKLSDFGIAKQLGDVSISQLNAVIGTQSYMSPEQERGEKATERSDLFSLAKTLYHAVTGEFSTVRDKRIPEMIREITLKALEDDSSLRHSSVAEFAAELRTVQMQLSGPASVAHDSAPLKDGECAHCHTINAVTRKFCKARDCGKPLVEPCPVCLAEGKNSPTPVWEARCGECNTVIDDHWADTEQDLENQAQEIETLAAEQNYEAALESLKPFHSLNHIRTKAWKDWALEIAATYQAQLAEQQAHCDRLLGEAQTAFQSAKYSLVTSLLDQIHGSQVTSEIRSLRASATARSQELDQLLGTLKQQAKTKDYEGLRRNVDRVLTISPGDKRVSTLDQQLRDRDESIRKKKEQLAIEKKQKEALLLKGLNERQVQERAQQVAEHDKSEELIGIIMKENYLALKEGRILKPIPDNPVPYPRHPLAKRMLRAPRPPIQPPPSFQPGSKAGERDVIPIFGLDIPFRWCPPGRFKMGSPTSEAGRIADRENQVNVELTHGFWLGETVVTQALYHAITNADPSHFKGSQRPVENLSWEEAQAFCQKLTHQLRDDGSLAPDWQVCLPTEAQWEYACRAGTTTAYFFGNDAARLGQFAWFDGNSKATHPVGTREANQWGLSDMHGNVWEWCADWYGDKLAGGTNPGGPAKGSNRVYRGGSWNFSAGGCRSAYRYGYDPSYRSYFLGFRLCLSSD